MKADVRGLPSHLPEFKCKTVLGLDTGFASVGWCVARVTSGNEFRTALFPEAMGCIRTESSAKKLDIKIGDDDFARTRYITKELHALINQYRPAIITCEAFSPMRNAGTVAKIGRCFGALAALSVVHDIPVLHATPTEIKKAVTGGKTASKEEVQRTLDSFFPKNPPIVLLHALPRGQHEHPCDALGSIVACWNDEPLRLLRSMLR